MTQKTSILVRATSGIAAVALALTGVSLVAAPVAAAPAPTVVTGGDVLPTETASNYQAWHEGYSHSVRAYSVKADGLHLGDGASSQIVKGLPTPTATDSDFAAQIATSSVDVVAGSVTYQIPISFNGGAGFTTLRTTSLTEGSHSLVPSGNGWEISRPIVDTDSAATVLIPSGAVDFANLISVLDAHGGFAPIGFGVQADTSATVAAITWNSDVYKFQPPVAGPVASTVVVRQVDLDPKENADGSNYTRWHEGNNWATPASSVQNNGLHLGDGNASTVIKGADVPVTRSQLASLIERASFASTGGPVTFQVPIFFTGSPGFTTLRSTGFTSGTHTFSLADTWATTKALPGFAPQGEGSLGDLLDAVFDNVTNVRLGGFGVQSDVPATVSSITWDATEYSFSQPVTQACVATSGPTATSINSNGWTFGESRSKGHNEFVDGGLHVFTEGGSSLDKAAGYKALSIPLSDAGVPAIDLTVNAGGSPSIQLGIDLTGDGTRDGYLVNEGNIYGEGKWWTNKTTFGVTAGGGYPSLGTLNDYLVANPDARIVNFGYSLGSGLFGDTVIRSITVGCQTYGFTAATPAAAATNVTVTGNDIRPNESVYAGWHEGYTNARRVYSVKDGGLRLAEGNKASQILYGLPAPLATTELETVLTGASLKVESGTASLQVPLFYGSDTASPGTQRFTTLRQEGLGTGIHTASVSDLWVTSSAIRTAAGAQLYAAGARVPLADLAAVISAQGDVKVLGFGVQANSLTVVSSLTGNNVKYTFSPIAAATTTAVRVTDPEILSSETPATYSSWHEGYANSSKAYKVTKDGLTLGTGSKSQIIKGVPLSAKTLADNLANAAVTVSHGNVTYQVPITFGAASTFTTLRSASIGAGSASFDLTSRWVSSRSFGTIVANQDYAFGDIFDQLNLQTNVHVLGFGVQAGAEATVSSISWDGIQYVFTGVIEVAAPVITGTPTVGQTLTATGGAVLPSNAVTSFQWKTDGANISGATSSTYLLTGNQFGTAITVVAAVSLPGYVDVSKASIGTALVAAAPLTTGVVTVSGVAQSQRMLTANTGAWGPGTVNFSYQWFKNGSAISGQTNATLLLGNADVGASFTVKVTGSRLGYVTASVTSAASGTVIPRDVTALRLEGADRYDVAVAISQSGFPNVQGGTVYLASGNGYADALSAAPAAAHQGAPLLLTGKDALPASVKAELIRLVPKTIVVAGGPASISAAVIGELESLTSRPTVNRIGGADRFAVSRSIAEYAFATATTAYIATGLNFPDALAAGPAAAHFGGPVILVDGTSTSVGTATLRVMKDLGVTTVKIAGGEATVSPLIETQLQSEFTTVKRNGGADRYGAAVAINLDEFTSATTVYLATGEKFPDALTGAALAGNQGAPLFVSPGSCVPLSVIRAISDLGASKVVLLGGRASLSADIERLQACE